MRKTLLEIKLEYERAAKERREPSPAELGAIIRARFPSEGPERDRYFRGMGEFVGQALVGLVIDPQMWRPPD